MTIIKLNLSGHQNVALEELGFEFPGAMHVDLGDKDLPIKVENFLKGKFGSEDIVHVALPGLAPLAAIVISIIHGKTGSFPVIQPLVRGESGFSPGPTLDLQEVRNEVGRRSRRDLVEI